MDVIEVAAREVAGTDAALVLTPHPLTVQGQRVLNAQAAALVAGETLASFLARHGVLAGQQWVVAIGGVEVPEILWGRVRPKHGHLIEARRRAEKNVLRMVAVIALVWFTAGLASAGIPMLGLAGGSFGAALAAGVVSMAGMAVINKLLGPKPLTSNTASNSVSPTYSLSGGRNRARQFEPMALVLGEPYCVPDLAAQPYTYFANGEQFLWQLFHAGINCAAISSVRIGQTAIDQYQQVTLSQDGMVSGNTGLPALAASVDTVAGALLDAPTAPGAYTTRTSSTGTIQLAVDVEASLFSVDGKGVYVARSLSVDVEYRAVGGSTWLPFVGSAATVVLTNADTKPLRATWTLAVAAGQYEVRMRKVDANFTGSTGANQVQWSTLKSYQQDTASYAGQSRVGVQIQASGQLNGALDEVNWRATALPMPYWNGSAWVTATNRATGLCNPGAILLLLARGVKDGTGKVLAGLGFDDAQIDVDSLQGFMVWCASKSFDFDYFVQETTSISDLMDAVAAAGMGAISWHTGKLGVIWFSDDQPIEAVLNMATTKAKSFSVSYDTQQTADELEFQYFDRARGDAWQSVRVLAPGVTAPAVTGRQPLVGVTTEAQAAILARFSMAQNAFQRKTVTVEVDLEHLTFRRGTLVALSHDVTQWGYGGRVQSAVNASGTVTLTLDDVVPAGAGSRYVGLRIPGERSYRIFPVAAFSGTSRTLTLASAWPGGVPVPGDSAGNPAHDTIWIYDFKATPGAKLRVADISPQGNMDGARVSLVPDSPEMWTYVWTGSYTPPPDTSGLTQGLPVLSGLGFTEQLVLQGDVYRLDVTASWTVAGAYERTEVFGSADSGPMQRLGVTNGTQLTWTVQGGQVWALEFRPYSALHAGVVVSASYTVVGTTMAPPNFDTFAVTANADGTRKFAFAYVATTPPATLAGALIRYVAGTVSSPAWGGMTALHGGVLTASPFETALLAAGDYTFAIKAVNTAGQESATPVYVNATLPAPPAPAELLTLAATAMTMTFDSAGTAIPSSQTITFTAVLLNLSGTPAWTAQAFDASNTLLGTVALSGTATVRTMTNAQFSTHANTKYVVVTVTVGAYTQTATVVALASGATGAAGLNTALVYAYKRAASAPTDNPGAVNWSFASSSISSPTTLANSWLKAIPTGIDPLYVTVATASGTGTTDTIAAGEWSTPVVLAQNGLNAATVYLYQRTATSTAPTVASDGTPAPYTFATGGLTSIPAGWSATVPASGGDYLWVVQATASSTGATDTIADTEWSTPVKLAINGTAGARGSLSISGTLAGLTDYPGRIAGRAKWSASSTLDETNAVSADAAATAALCAAAGVANSTANLVMGDQITLKSDAGGATWTQSGTSAFGTNAVRAVARGVTNFVAVGDGGKVATSPDGMTWTARTSGFGSTAIRSVAYGAGGFVICGAGGVRAYSVDDGVTWTLCSVDFAAGAVDANAVTFGNGIWAMVGNSGKCETSTDGGKTWSATTTPFGSTAMLAVAYGLDVFVAVGNSGALYTSPTGATWTSRTSGFGTNAIYAVTFGDGRFVAGGAAGNITYTSNPTATWPTATVPGSSNAINGLAWGSKLFLAMYDTGVLYTSADAATWTVRTSSYGTTTLLGGCWGTGAFVTVGATGKTAYSVSAVTVSITGYWSGTSWLEPGVRIPGNLLVEGTISAGTGVFNKAVITPSGYYYVASVVVTSGVAYIDVPVTGIGSPLYSCALDTGAGTDLMYTLQWFFNTASEANFRLHVFDKAAAAPFTGTLGTLKIWIF